MSHKQKKGLMTSAVSRRSFLGSLAAGAAFSPFMNAQRSSSKPSQPRRPYADASLPPVQPRFTAGEVYEADMPDTLDLADRAALAINGLTRVADPRDDYTIFFLGDFVDWIPGRAFLRHTGLGD